jgi:hypothetical protein
MSRVVITVGAQADRSLVDVVRPLVDSAKKARAQATADARAATRAQIEAQRQAGRMTIEGFRAEARLHQQYVRAKLQADRDAAKESMALQRRMTQETVRGEREKAKAVEHVYQIRQRYIAQQEREASASAKGRASTALDYGAGAMRSLGGLVRGGIGVASSVAKGAGVNWDLESMVGSSVDMQKQAVDLSNAAFRGQKGEKRLDPGAIVKQARAVGGEFALDPSKVIGGLAKFQESSGDYTTGQAGLREWSMIAKASNTDLEEMIGTAGQISVALGDAFGNDTQAKVKGITDVIKTFGAQGQEGAIEYSNLVTQFPKLQAAAAKFEGDRSGNLKKMGALVQIARQYGGAPSAAAAATSIAGLGNILSTPARVKAFEAEGIDVFSKRKGQEGKVRDIEDIMKDSLAKTGMDPLRFKALFANVVGAKPAEGLATAYRDAGGGAKGQAAVDAMMAKFTGSWSDDKIKGDLAASMGTTASKVQQINNELAKAGEELAGKVLPQLVKAAPDIMKFVESMTAAAGWAAENPGKMIVLAITGSIAKAAVGDAVKSGIEGLMKGGISAGGGASGGFLGGAGLALALGMATIMIAAATISISEEKKNKGREESLGDTDKALALAMQAKAAAAGGKALSPEQMKDAETQRAALQERIDAASKHTTGDTLQAYNPFSDRSLRQEGKESNDQMMLGALKSLAASFDASMAKLAGKEFKATVTVSAGTTPGVDPKGRK